MIIYKDAFTQDELFSDAYKLKVIEDDGIFTFESKVVSRKEGQIDDSLIGGNASAEETAEELADGSVESGFEFVLDNKLVEKAFMDKKECQGFIKKLVKGLMDKVPADKMDNFKKASTVWAKLITADYGDMGFYAGAKCIDADVHMIMPVKWGADGVTGTVYVLRAGLIEEKC